MKNVALKTEWLKTEMQKPVVLWVVACVLALPANLLLNPANRLPKLACGRYRGILLW